MKNCFIDKKKILCYKENDIVGRFQHNQRVANQPQFSLTRRGLGDLANNEFK